MRHSEMSKPKQDADKSKPLLEENVSSGFAGVPQAVATEFLQGLDDVKHGRVIDGDTVIAEGRALLAEYQKKKQKDGPALKNGS